MSIFFKDYAINPEQSDIINKSFQSVFEILQEQTHEIERNHNISKILTYRRIRFQKIDISGATYQLKDLLNDESILSVVGINPSISYNQKLEIWNSMSPSEKSNMLDIANKSILLTSFTHLLDEDDFTARKFNVIDFKLIDMNNNRLTLNVDYSFKNNRIFLLKEFVADFSNSKKNLIMQDIVIDLNTSEDILGNHLNIPYNFEFTKTDYNETMKGFIEAAAGGPTLDNLTESLGRYSALDDVKVYDKYSSSLVASHFWGENGFTGTLTNFDFVVAMPVSLVYKPEKLAYIRKFFNQIKPSYTNFIFTPELVAKDSLLLKFKDDKINIEGTRGAFEDSIEGISSLENFVSRDTIDKIDYIDFEKYKTLSSISDKFDLSLLEQKICSFISEEISDELKYGESNKKVGNLSVSNIVRFRECGNGYYLDEDYFDSIYIMDCSRKIVSHSTYDVFKDFYDNNVVTPILNPKDNITSLEITNHIANLNLLDVTYHKCDLHSGEDMFISDTSDAFDRAILTSNISAKSLSEVIDSIYAKSDVFEVKSYGFIKDNIECLSYQRNLMNLVLSENKVYFPWNIKHDEFVMDNSMIFDPLQMKSEIKNNIGISAKSIIEYSDSIGDIMLNQIVNDNIKRFDSINKIVTLSFNTKILNFVPKFDNYYIADNGDVFDSAIIKELIGVLSSVDFTDTIPEISDSVCSLNSQNVYDKIISKNDVEYSSTNFANDNLLMQSSANVVKCDSVFKCDYENSSNIFLDTAPDDYDNKSIGECIEIILIPKK